MSDDPPEPPPPELMVRISLEAWQWDFVINTLCEWPYSPENAELMQNIIRQLREGVAKLS